MAKNKKNKKGKSKKTSDSTYVGSVREKEGKGDMEDYLLMGLSQDDLQTLADNCNDRGYVNCFISPRKDGGDNEYGLTHTIKVLPPDED